jgi:hypothetical protein
MVRRTFHLCFHEFGFHCRFHLWIASMRRFTVEILNRCYENTAEIKVATVRRFTVKNLNSWWGINQYHLHSDSKSSLGLQFYSVVHVLEKCLCMCALMFCKIHPCIGEANLRCSMGSRLSRCSLGVNLVIHAVWFGYYFYVYFSTVKCWHVVEN